MYTITEGLFGIDYFISNLSKTKANYEDMQMMTEWHMPSHQQTEMKYEQMVLTSTRKFCCV